LAALLQIFGRQPADLGQWQAIGPDDVPEPYRTLLVHDNHMTVTVEAHHGTRVNLRPIEVRAERDWYARKILLTRSDTGRVVQFGIMRIDFRHCSEKVRQAILERKTPLGRILIEYDVLRRIDPETFLRVVPAGELLDDFQLDMPVATYGRLATIFCRGEPAVELLEVVAPEPEDIRRAQAAGGP
jgi:hypothetical protein